MRQRVRKQKKRAHLVFTQAIAQKEKYNRDILRFFFYIARPDESLSPTSKRLCYHKPNVPCILRGRLFRIMSSLSRLARSMHLVWGPNWCFPCSHDNVFASFESGDMREIHSARSFFVLGRRVPFLPNVLN